MATGIDRFKHNELYWIVKEMQKEIAELKEEVEANKPKPRKTRAKKS